MSAERDRHFDQPRIAINRVYTRSGDRGTTGLAGGQRVAKNDVRIEAYGTVDELNSFVGLALKSVRELSAPVAELEPILLRVQHELFNAGSVLATLPEDIHPRQARITAAESDQLEGEMDRMNDGLPTLRSFVLPGGCRLNAELHVCRTVCRRAERVCVAMGDSADAETLRYLNRLGDAFFVWSRWASHRLGIPEALWEPDKAAAAGTGLDSPADVHHETDHESDEE
jgi:cob(I)alamin adenosyltransferase